MNIFKGQDYAELTAWLNENWGNRVEFDNGCTVWLENDDGILWRRDPYGQDSACRYSEGWETRLKRWVSYWDEPRTEAGLLTEAGPHSQPLSSKHYSDIVTLRLVF